MYTNCFLSKKLNGSQPYKYYDLHTFHKLRLLTDGFITMNENSIAVEF